MNRYFWLVLIPCLALVGGIAQPQTVTVDDGHGNIWQATTTMPLHIVNAPPTQPVVPTSMPVVTTQPFAPPPGDNFPAYSTANPCCAFMLAALTWAPDPNAQITLAPGPLPTTLPSNTTLNLGVGTYSLPGSCNAGGAHQAIRGVPGTIINWAGPSGGTMFQTNGTGFWITGCTFTGPAGNVFAGNGAGTIIVANTCPAGGAANFADYADTGGPGIGGPVNCSIVGNTVGVLGQYAIFMGGRNMVVMGNTIAGSQNQDVVRGTGINPLIDGNTIGNPDKLAAIAIQGGSQASIIRNTISGGPLEIGPILTPQAVNPPLQSLTQVWGNTLTIPINVDAGTVHTFIGPNTITTTPVCINVNQPSAAFPKLDVEDLQVYSATLANNGPDGAAIQFNPGWTATPGIQATVTQNTYAQPGVTIGPGGYFSASVKVLSPNMSQIQFGGNVWGKPAGYSGVAPGMTFLVGGQTAPTQYQPCPAGDRQE